MKKLGKPGGLLLGPDDIVEIATNDFIVTEAAEYRSGLERMHRYILKGSKQNLAILVLSHGETFLLKEIELPAEITEEAQEFTYEGVDFVFLESGVYSTMVSNRDGEDYSKVNLKVYEGEEGELFLIEKWGRKAQAFVGTKLQMTDVNIYPAI